MAELADYAWLIGPAAESILSDLAEDEAPLHSQLQRLRKLLSTERARLVVEQAGLRRRAVAKFGRLAERLFFTELALQQATDLWVGRYKASRFPAGQPIVDYCCGIGGDLLPMAERAPVVGWDRAPELALLAETNLHVTCTEHRARVHIGDVAKQTPTIDSSWHLDPDRRVDGRRSTQVRWHSPGPETIDRWLETSPQGVVKLAPATKVPQAWRSTAELEWISRDRQCRQQLVWFGQLATSPGQHRATLLQTPRDDKASPIACSFVAKPGLRAPLESQLRDYVYDTDPAIRAADLTGALANELELAAISPGACYLTSNHPVDHPLVSRFRVTDLLPLREKTLARHLGELGIGRLEIKKRGVQREPETLRHRLNLTGEASATLLLTRQGDREIAILAQRCHVEREITG